MLGEPINAPREWLPIRGVDHFLAFHRKQDSPSTRRGRKDVPRGQQGLKHGAKILRQFWVALRPPSWRPTCHERLLSTEGGSEDVSSSDGRCDSLHVAESPFTLGRTVFGVVASYACITASRAFCGVFAGGQSNPQQEAAAIVTRARWSQDRPRAHSRAGVTSESI